MACRPPIARRRQQQQDNSSGLSGGHGGTQAVPALAPLAAGPARITDVWLSESLLGEVAGQVPWMERCALLARKLAPDAAAVDAWTRLLAADFNASAPS